MSDGQLMRELAVVTYKPDELDGIFVSAANAAIGVLSAKADRLQTIELPDKELEAGQFVNFRGGVLCVRVGWKKSE